MAPSGKHCPHPEQNIPAGQQSRSHSGAGGFGGSGGRCPLQRRSAARPEQHVFFGLPLLKKSADVHSGCGSPGDRQVPLQEHTSSPRQQSALHRVHLLSWLPQQLRGGPPLAVAQVRGSRSEALWHAPHAHTSSAWQHSEQVSLEGVGGVRLTVAEEDVVNETVALPWVVVELEDLLVVETLAAGTTAKPESHTIGQLRGTCHDAWVGRLVREEVCRTHMASDTH